MSAQEVAAEHARNRAELAEGIRQRFRDAWDRVDPARIIDTWDRQVARLLVALTTAQSAAAGEADDYLTEVLTEQGINPAAAGRLEVGSLAGIASDGRDLETLIRQPAITALTAIGSGRPVDRAMTTSGFLAGLIGHTQVADAGRVGDGVALMARRNAGGYVRMIVGGTCSRCVILAGRHYAVNAGFDRHPKCDCVHVPTAENDPSDLRVNPRAHFDSLSEAEQDKVFGKAGAAAIREGADMSRVVNARSGMYTADGRLFTTAVEGKRPRLMPEEIFRSADSREDAIRLLRLHGYLK